MSLLDLQGMLVSAAPAGGHGCGGGGNSDGSASCAPSNVSLTLCHPSDISLLLC
jgi:hypothetical protein